MKSFFDLYNKIEEVTLVVSLVITVVVIFFQIVSRNFFNHALPWSEELSRYIFVYQVWLGASIATRKGSHIRVEFIFTMFNGKLKPYAEILSKISWFVFCAFLAYNSCFFVLQSMKTGNVSAAMGVPMFIPYLSIPIGATVMGLRLLGLIVTEFKAIKSPDLRVAGE
ncbi:MAG: hypothetical protein CSA23_03650 [Deltaproteobacteria bacterium]|nr:MAG: hypothetical protein CSA23_03650 [Deltaproteobacteria bacterium]